MSASSSSQQNDNEELSLNHITPIHTIMTEIEPQHQIYLSVIWQSGQLGVAYYNLETTEINMMLDAPETERFTTLESIIREINPTCILTSSKQDERLPKYLKTIALLFQKFEEACQELFDSETAEWYFHRIQNSADRWQKSFGK